MKSRECTREALEKKEERKGTIFFLLRAFLIMAKLTASQERELKDAFDLFDSGRFSFNKTHSYLWRFLDHSGKISRAELKRVLKALNIKSSDSDLQQLMTLMDRDNSGDIDFNEFKHVMAESFFKKYSRQELYAAFKKFDADNNGYITTKELSDILSRMGRQLDRNEVNAIIRTLDTSGDGRLSFDEFCKLFD